MYKLTVASMLTRASLPGLLSMWRYCLFVVFNCYTFCVLLLSHNCSTHMLLFILKFRLDRSFSFLRAAEPDAKLSFSVSLENNDVYHKADSRLGGSGGVGPLLPAAGG